MNMNDFICDIFFDKRLLEIENGLPVKKLAVFLGPQGDCFEAIGDNTGSIIIEKITDIFKRFGKPIDIEIDEKWQPDFNFILKYIKPEAHEMDFKTLKQIKSGN